MTEVEKNIADGNLTQKEIIQLLLHNAQHMATREEVKSDIVRLEDKASNLATRDALSKVEIALKEDISRVETTLKEDISRVEITLKEDISRVEITLKEDISRVETTLKEDISRVETTLKEDISRVETTLKEDISRVETALKTDNKELSKRVDRFMFWSLGLTLTSTFLILGLIYKTMP